jgi:hypothetical protein
MDEKPTDDLAIPTFLKREPLDPVAAEIKAEQEETKRRKARGRIEKMKAKKSGATTAMPLTGKAALDAIRGTDEEFLREAADRLRQRMSRTARDIVEIGRDLIGVKERVGHGNFLSWIDREFAMSEWAARRLMNVANLFKSGTVPDLPPTVLYELAGPNTADEVRVEITERAEAGQKIKPADVRSLKKRAADVKAAIKAAADRAEAAAKAKPDRASKLKTPKPKPDLATSLVDQIDGSESRTMPPETALRADFQRLQNMLRTYAPLDALDPGQIGAAIRQFDDDEAGTRSRLLRLAEFAKAVWIASIDEADSPRLARNIK